MLLFASRWLHFINLAAELMRVIYIFVCMYVISILYFDLLVLAAFVLFLNCLLYFFLFCFCDNKQLRQTPHNTLVRYVHFSAVPQTHAARPSIQARLLAAWWLLLLLACINNKVTLTLWRLRLIACNECFIIASWVLSKHVRRSRALPQSTILG